MPNRIKRILRAGCFATAVAIALPTAGIAAGDLLFISTGDSTRPPIGWMEFCADRPKECDTQPSTPRDVVLRDIVTAGTSLLDRKASGGRAVVPCGT